MNPDGDVSRPLPTIRSANVLFLVAMVLLVTAGAWFQSISLLWGLHATEFLLLLPLVLLFMRLGGLPARTVLRLRRPGALPAILSLAAGAGVWLAGWWLEQITASGLGYAPATPVEMFPTTIGQGVLLMAALTIAAPLCEELMFRGYMQSAYERRGPAVAIIGGSLLFAFFHMRFQGLVPLLPIGLVLGYVVWRSDSIVTGMLVHAINNALSGGWLIGSTLRPDLFAAGPAPAHAAAGALVAGAALWALNRLAPPVPPADLPPAPPERRGRIGRAWPLAVAGVIWILMAILELVLYRFPGLIAAPRPALGPAPWSGPARWQYDLLNPAGTSVGEADCRLDPDGGDWVLVCRARAGAWQEQSGGAARTVAAHERYQMARWSEDDLSLVEASGWRQSEGHRLTHSVSAADELIIQARLDGAGTASSLPVPAEALYADEWPWRLSGLRFSNWYAARTTVGWPARWDTAEQVPGLTPALVAIQGAEPVATPAGNFLTWRVSVGEATAWYDTVEPYTLVQYLDGSLMYVLKSAE